MNILVLGGDGFVGKNVVEVLTDAGKTVFIASRKNGYDLRVLQDVLRLYETSKPDVIVNCAAHVGSLNYVTQMAGDIVVDNTKMIIAMYEAMALLGIKPLVINPIANCAYPAKLDTFVEDFWWDGHLHRSVLSYGSTRRTLWAVAESFEMQHQIRTISLLVPNMYGEYDSVDPNKAHALNALISKFVKAQKQEAKELEIWGTGAAIREWLYAKDFGKIINIIIDNPNLIGLDEPINIAQNFGISVRELVRIIQNNFQYPVKLIWNSSMPDGAPKKVMDDRRFRKVFPDFLFEKFEMGISKTIEYYSNMYPY